MPRISAANRRMLSLKWLQTWEAAGRPLIDPHTHATTGQSGHQLIMFGSFNGIVIEHTGAFRRQRFGNASLIRIGAANETVTALFCQLARMRLCTGGVVAIRSSAGPSEDLRVTARLMLSVHIRAAICCRDPSAVHGLTHLIALPTLSRIEDLLLRDLIADGKRDQRGSRPVRL